MRKKTTSSTTPMFQQYEKAKAEHPDSLLFFRMGDFYELFYEDARTVSQELGLKLTSRSKNKTTKKAIPMAGVPHRAVSGYIRKLVKKGYHIAICEQLEKPSKGKNIVSRGVVRVITPGLLLDEETLDAKRNNFIVALALSDTKDADTIALTSLDLSTGELRFSELQNDTALKAELRRLQPSEVLIAGSQEAVLRPIVDSMELHVTIREADALDLRKAIKKAVNNPLSVELQNQQNFLGAMKLENMAKTVRAVRLRDSKSALAAFSLLIDYLASTQGGVPAHLDEPRGYHTDDFLVLDAASAANLELFETLMGGHRKGSVFSVIDKTVSSSGGRRLRTWLSYPLTNVKAILTRQKAVSSLVSNMKQRESLRKVLRGTSDIQRMTSKLSSGQGNARELSSLRDTLKRIPSIIAELRSVKNERLQELASTLDPCEDVVGLIDAAIVDDPPNTLTDGGIIAEGFSDELDKIILIMREGKNWILRFEATERLRTRINSLKVKHNRVFGYYIEVTHSNREYVPDNYIRKQTLTNSERYYTPELKEYEETVLGAGERRYELEYKLFESVRESVIDELVRLRNTASKLAEIDALCALAELSVQQRYVAPEISAEIGIVIQDGRHPVVETMLINERFIPNDIRLNVDRRLLLITGPNMSGKSTVIRQVALITLLAQIGSHVPAKKAKIGVVDQIFSRVGASDNLTRGQSTFMVEMSETAHILRHATARSLVILDEIGRGTSTYDGLSLAWAVTEHLHDKLESLTLFATHYHEITDLAQIKKAVFNMSVAAKERKNDIIFLRTLVEGPANRSYGIQVARLAGVPESVVLRAQEVLTNLESTEFDEENRPVLARKSSPKNPHAQLSIFGNAIEFGVVQKPLSQTDPLIEELKKLPLNTFTPIEAFNTLYRLQKDALNRSK